VKQQGPQRDDFERRMVKLTRYVERPITGLLLVKNACLYTVLKICRHGREVFFAHAPESCGFH
jgi:hypothetical protein